MTYKITDWEENYENNRTRTMKNMQWVPLPNSHDSDGFTEIMDRENCMEIFGAWVLILQVASKCHPRGTLLRKQNKPHNSASLARMTRGKKEIFDEAIKILLNIGWIVEIEPKTAIAGDCQEGAGCAHPTDEEGRKEGREGIEGNGKKTAKKKVVKIPPEFFEVEKYCKDRSNGVDPNKWFNFYSSKGWLIGKNKMKDWKAAVRTWENSKSNFQFQQNSQPQENYLD